MVPRVLDLDTYVATPDGDGAIEDRLLYPSVPSGEDAYRVIGRWYRRDQLTVVAGQKGGTLVMLWCAACGQAHRFTAGDVERIVYTLDAMVLDARTEPNSPEREDAGKDPMVADALCLDAVRDSSWSSEGYAEWIAGPVDHRREAARLARTPRAEQ